MGVIVKIKDGSNGVQNINLDDFDKETVFFGKASSNDIVLRTPTVSREHGTFYKKGSDWYIKDHSSNGTRFQQKKISEMRLRDGMLLEINGETSDSSSCVKIKVEVKEDPVKIPPISLLNTTDHKLIRRREDEEKTITVIKKGCFFNLLMSDFFIRDKVTLTNKRIYLYRKRGFINVRQTDEKLDLQDVTSVSIARVNLAGLLILAAIALFASIYLSDNKWSALSSLGSALLLAYTWLRTWKKYLRIEYAGGHGKMDVGLGRSNYVQAKDFADKVMATKEERDMHIIISDPTEEDYTTSMPSIRL